MVKKSVSVKKNGQSVTKIEDNGQSVKKMEDIDLSNNEFKLYVVSKDSPKNKEVVLVVDGILKKTLKNSYNLQVIDILEMPEQAAADQILVTPSWMKTIPKPKKKVVGQLGDQKNALKALSLLIQE